MKLSRKISILDQLEIYHLEAYFGVKLRRARQWRKEILEYIGTRKSGVLFVWDLAEFDGFDPNDEETKKRFLDQLNQLFSFKDEG